MRLTKELLHETIRNGGAHSVATYGCSDPCVPTWCAAPAWPTPALVPSPDASLTDIWVEAAPTGAAGLARDLGGGAVAASPKLKVSTQLEVSGPAGGCASMAATVGAGSFA